MLAIKQTTADARPICIVAAYGVRYVDTCTLNAAVCMLQKIGPRHSPVYVAVDHIQAKPPTLQPSNN